MTRPPSVDQLARSLSHYGLPHPILVDIARQAIADGSHESADEMVRQRQRAMLMPVINATGVLLHTNLGRAPVAVTTEPTYTNLELSLASGKRGSRQQTVGDVVATACGAEAAMVVNNCAAAVLLVLAALATDKPVAVGRGEMVEIGGGFRIPDVMAQSGAHLIEVGTTNRSRLSDYVNAASGEAGRSDIGRGSGPVMVLKVHRSNYKIVGFTEDVSVAALARAPELADTILAVDLGSGLLDANCPWLDGPPPAWLANEPAVRQTLEAGADLVMFSGDKLFGGPQAGIIVGRGDLVERCGRHPLARALRPGSLVLHGIQDTALAYLDRRGDDIPLWRMVAGLKSTAPRAQKLLELLGSGDGGPRGEIGGFTIAAVPCQAVPGGGTLPTVTVPSNGLRISGDHTDALRDQDPPIIARVDDGDTVVDLATVDPDDDPFVAKSVASVLGAANP